MVCKASPYPEINFMIGSACNWHCSYCLQGKEVGFDRKVDIDEFIDKFKRYLSDRNITQFTRVQYWGGEPLLYLETIKKLHEAFKNYPKTNKDRIVTNGSLITDEFVDYVTKDNGFFINLSYHDGQLSEEQWQKVLKIENLTITGLLHHKRLTLDEFYAKFRHIWEHYGRCTHWCISPIFNTAGVPSDYRITKDDVDTMFEYHKNVVTPLALKDVFYSDYLNVFLMLFVEHDDIAPEDNYCYNKKVISVDLRGNSYFCHHDCESDTIAGNIFNPLSIHKTLPPQPEKCYNCNLQPLCHGGCMREVDHDLACYMFHRWYEFLVWLRKNNPQIIRQELWDQLDDAI